MKRETFASAQERLGGEVKCSFPFAGSPPLLVEPTPGSKLARLEDGIEWMRANQTAIDDLVCDTGAVVLRGFGARNTQDFERFLAHYPVHGFGYSGGATPRSGIGNSTRVFAATYAAPDIRIPLHQEMTYMPNYPSRLAFFCQLPAETGGETLLGNMRAFTQALPERILRKVDALGVIAIRNFRCAGRPHPAEGHPVIIHLTWQKSFSAETREQAEAECRKLGLSWKWEDDDSLTTFFKDAGCGIHRRTGERIWINHLQTQVHHPRWMPKSMVAAYQEHYFGKPRPRPYHARYGDGSEMDEADFLQVHDLLDAVTVAPRWQAGDVMIVDNIATAHGRASFTGRRDVQVSLLA